MNLTSSHCESAIFRPNALVLACLAALATPAQAEFFGLGDFPGGTYSSTAYAISADGLTIVGESNGASSAAFRWTSGGGMQDLGIASAYSSAFGLSGDGSVIVGYYDNAGHTEAFRWTSGGYVGLGTGGYTHSFAFDVSDDGSTIVGHASGAGQNRAYAWTAGGGMLLLDYLPGSSPVSQAFGVSGNGAIAVGYSRLAVGGNRAVSWDTATGAATALGFLPGSTGQSTARAISTDGTVIVGGAQNAVGNDEAFRWTQAGGMVGLGSVAGYADSYATAMSADGGVVVGTASTGGGSELAVRWAQASGMQSVSDWLSSTGVSVGAWQLLNANGVSGDGQTVVGVGYNPAGDVEAFVARPGLLAGVTNLSESVASLQHAAQLPIKVGRVGATQSAPGLDGLMGWSVAPLYLHVSGSRADLGGAALTWRRPGLALTGRMGILDAAATGLHDGGQARFDGPWLGAGASLAVSDLLDRPGLRGLEMDAALHFGRYDTDIRRNYLNGASIETASGDTDTDDFTALARLGWRVSAREDVDLIPYVQWLYNRLAVDAYAEDGSVLAGQVSAMRRSASETAIGVNASWRYQQGITLRAGVGLHHLLDGKGAAVSVTLPGLGTVSSPGQAYDVNWHEFSAGLDWDTGKRSRLSASFTTAGGSDYPENWTVGLAMHMGL